ncbi:hypothetical protein EDF22_0607 [Rathayibacter sp. PhB127]|uniref:hypothetical protein n=1 Tax=Rathayibacter sp. PhB127 TaxID=2485176 RepID=UPI000F4CC92A|nr:hypothetical protein [Rathayibacter sp. PhB127]ROS28876.1 hypothetical protein EDF22_0607 [Rathayibacter sp. PhB127]
MSTYTCTVLTPEQQSQLLTDVRAGMSPAEALEKYGASRSVLQRVLRANGQGFVNKRIYDDSAVIEALRSGESLHIIHRRTGISWQRLVRVESEHGPFADRTRNKRAEKTARMIELAPTMTGPQIAAHLGLSSSTVSLYLKSAGVKPVQTRRAAGTVKPPSLRVVKDPKPAPIKRSKAKPPKRDPLYLTCSRKHPITKSNRVKGTLNECLVCKRRGVSLPTNLVAARDALIAELEAVIAREVAELTADLRPEMEKAA